MKFHEYGNLHLIITVIMRVEEHLQPGRMKPVR